MGAGGTASSLLLWEVFLCLVLVSFGCWFVSRAKAAVRPFPVIKQKTIGEPNFGFRPWLIMIVNQVQAILAELTPPEDFQFFLSILAWLALVTRLLLLRL